MDEFEDDDLHDKLMDAIVEYAKAAEHWDKNHSHRAYWKISKAIREVRRLSTQRQKDVKEERDRIWEEREKNKTPKEKRLSEINRQNMMKARAANPIVQAKTKEERSRLIKKFTRDKKNNSDE